LYGRWQGSSLQICLYFPGYVLFKHKIHLVCVVSTAVLGPLSLSGLVC
jgi:hypothetical protein